MTEDRLAMRLRNVRKLAQRAQESGQKLDPRVVIAAADGERA